MRSTFGYDFALESANALSWRMTGRDEGKSDLPLAPWGCLLSERQKPLKAFKALARKSNSIE